MFLIAEEDDGTVPDEVLFFGEVEEIVEGVKIMGVENIVVLGEYVVECGIEW